MKCDEPALGRGGTGGLGTIKSAPTGARDQAVVFVQALQPARVHLRVAEPSRWRGELTDAGALLAEAPDPAHLGPPLSLLLRSQVVALGAQSPL